MTPDTPVHILESQRQQIKQLMLDLGFAEGFAAYIAMMVKPGNAEEVLRILEEWKREKP